MKRLLPLVLLLLGLPTTLSAAINPEHFVNAATDHLQLREIGRVVQVTRVGESSLRRVTLVGEVVDERDAARTKVGRTIIIDYTVDLTARARAAAAHAERNGNRPGPQFLGEPDPPEPDADGRYWAHLALAGAAREDGVRRAGAAVQGTDYAASGEVYVPAAAQYSFQAD